MKAKKQDKIDSIKGIAKKLGVAPSSVSRALSGAKGVSPALREKALALAKSFAFSPDSAASRLRTGKTDELVMVSTKNRSEISSLRDNNLFYKAKGLFNRVTALVYSEGEDPIETIAKAAASKPGAIVLSNCNVELPESLIESLTDRGIQLLTIDCKSEGLDNINVERSSGTAQMARLFLLSGAKNPVFISAVPFSEADTDNRLVGIKKGLRSLGMELRQEQVVEFSQNLSANAPAAGFEAAERILKTMFTDAIFCYSDLCAIGVLRALMKHGVDIPKDIRIAGFDNTPFSEYLPISLTTVAQPVEELTDVALELLKARREDFKIPARSLAVKCSLIIRESAPVSDYALREKIFQQIS